MKKRKKDKEVDKKGEFVLHNEEVPLKMPMTAKGKGRPSSAEGKNVKHVAKVRPLNPTWSP